MRVSILTLYAALIVWVGVTGQLETAVAMTVTATLLALVFRPMPAARAITGWARANIARRGA